MLAIYIYIYAHTIQLLEIFILLINMFIIRPFSQPAVKRVIRSERRGLMKRFVCNPERRVMKPRHHGERLGEECRINWCFIRIVQRSSKVDVCNWSSSTEPRQVLCLTTGLGTSLDALNTLISYTL